MSFGIFCAYFCPWTKWFRGCGWLSWCRFSIKHADHVKLSQIKAIEQPFAQISFGKNKSYCVYLLFTLSLLLQFFFYSPCIISVAWTQLLLNVPMRVFACWHVDMSQLCWGKKNPEWNAKNRKTYFTVLKHDNDHEAVETRGGGSHIDMVYIYVPAFWALFQ